MQCGGVGCDHTDRDQGEQTTVVNCCTAPHQTVNLSPTLLVLTVSIPTAVEHLLVQQVSFLLCQDSLTHSPILVYIWSSVTIITKYVRQCLNHPQIYFYFTLFSIFPNGL